MKYLEVDYEYYDDGSGSTVGITTVWLLSENKTVYIYCNDEGCSMMSVDFLRHNIPINEILGVDVLLDDLPFEDFREINSQNKYLQLYRSCMKRYIVDYCNNCPDEDGFIEVPYEMLPDEVQEQIDTTYITWHEETYGNKYLTNGYTVQKG